jgi:hypothetical protein
MRIGLLERVNGFGKEPHFGIVKNYFRTTLIEKSCLGPKTNFCFSSKACVIGFEEELIQTLFHEWMF